MIGLLQRVTHASVAVAGEEIAAIQAGLVVLVGVERGDGIRQATRLAERLLNYRVFNDAAGKMNRSLLDIRGGLLLVPQFTLAADTASGNRPGFSHAAAPELGRRLFGELVAAAHQHGQPTQTGRFGADMQLSLCNDGPVTFTLRVPPDP
jgi:D-tyrosyl-tRNA(Tyr) deacylase